MTRKLNWLAVNALVVALAVAGAWGGYPVALTIVKAITAVCVLGCMVSQSDAIRKKFAQSLIDKNQVGRVFPDWVCLLFDVPVIAAYVYVGATGWAVAAVLTTFAELGVKDDVEMEIKKLRGTAA